MADELNKLITFWRHCDFKAPPYFHPQDESVLREVIDLSDTVPVNSLKEFVTGKTFGAFDDKQFHLSLLPVPYGGNIEQADIIILLLNPGFHISDYHAELHMPAYREKAIANIRQSDTKTEFPFIWLDPQFCWHSGFMWWEKKLQSVLKIIAEKNNCTYLSALQNMSKRLAQIELVPYHSKFFGTHRLLEKLPSSIIVREFVKSVLVPEARNGNKTIIVTRQVASWDLISENDKVDDIVLYKKEHTRGASLSADSDGGKAILRRFEAKPIR